MVLPIADYKKHIHTKNMLQDKSQILELIGKETILKFDFMCDNIMVFKTLSPIRDYKNYEVEVFFESGESFFCYEKLEELIREKQVFEVNESSMEAPDEKELSLIHI